MYDELLLMMLFFGFRWPPFAFASLPFTAAKTGLLEPNTGSFACPLCGGWGPRKATEPALLSRLLSFSGLLAPRLDGVPDVSLVGVSGRACFR